MLCASKYKIDAVVLYTCAGKTFEDFAKMLIYTEAPRPKSERENYIFS
jgi:hypothetical protein